MYIVNAWLTSLTLQQLSTYGIHARTGECVFMALKQRQYEKNPNSNMWKAKNELIVYFLLFCQHYGQIYNKKIT